MYSRTSIQLTLLGAIRELAAPLVSTAALVGSTSVFSVRFTTPYVALALVSALLCWIAIGRDQRSDSPIPASSLAVAGETLVAWSAVVGTLLLMAYATKSSESFSRRALFVWFAATPILLVATLAVVNAWIRAIVASARNARRAVVVGDNVMSARLAKTINTRPDLGLRLEHVFQAHERWPARSRGDRAVATRVAAIHDYVNRHRIDVVFVALALDNKETRVLLDGLKDTTASVYLVPDISVCDRIQARSDEIDGIPIIALCESPLRGANVFAKRSTDVVFASVLLVCALPLMLGIAAAIKLTSRGSVFFKQHRYGLDGERIVVYKFRTMSVAENGRRVPQATRDDPRVTRVGRFLRRTSLDELPQLLNVLSGSMSLVGPRPHAVAHNEQYRKLISGYMVRHKVAPGITGLAQVNGCRGETATVEEMRRRVQYDLEYLRRWCWWLDLKILGKTVALLFRDEHAY